MSIKVFNKGEHPGGFIGVRVQHKGMKRQKYLSFRAKRGGKDLISKEQRAALVDSAKSIDSLWRAEFETKQRARMVSRDAPNVQRCRNIGVYGITIGMRHRVKNGKQTSRAFFRAAFGKGSKHSKEFSILKDYEGAWRAAVDHWAVVYDVDRKIKIKALRMIPHPSKFLKLLEQQKKEGYTPSETITGSLRALVAEYDATEKKTLTRVEADDLAASIAAAVQQHKREKHRIRG